jgi:nitroimidazol reductase NimA-like FMN-containing flavoprotein (pyridoxamine 5'-phosphate oxidase superfamily)
MDDAIRAKILEILGQHRLMTIATNRTDGWPQATTVGYANDDLTIYFLCGPKSQKAHNIARDNRVSLTIDHGYVRSDVDHRLIDGRHSQFGARSNRNIQSD